MTAWQALRTHLRRRPLLADALLALLLYACQVVLWSLGPREWWGPSWPMTLLWLGLGTATLALRRRATELAVLLLAALTLAVLLLGNHLQASPIAIITMTYTAAARLPLLRAVVAAALLWVPPAVFAVTVLDVRQPPLRMLPASYVAFTVLAVLVCVLVGRTAHHRRAYIAALEDRSRDAGAADEALATIEETGRTALREMRRLLDVLRTDQEPAGELAPQPGLAHLAGLVEQVREAGLPVTLTMEGNAGALDPGVALTIYRIVQEALTNALKHAGAATAEVRLDIGAYWLSLEVCDTGRGPRVTGGRIGHGLLGMRERVMLYGGTLRTGPRPGGGFRVSARIPVDALDGGSQ